MAIIKCPECGHQISDKAPTCPSCGVEIAGKLTKCGDCGEIYFNYQEMCPNCHRPNLSLLNKEAIHTEKPAATSPSVPMMTGGHLAITQQAGTPPPPPTTQQKGKGKRNYTPLVVAFIFAIALCGVMYYFYDNANKNKEMEAYEYAMQSSDPTVLQSYLDTYIDADEAHRNAVEAHLEKIKQVDIDWTNALVSGSKSSLEAYLQKYPDSPHKPEVLSKIDSIDWQVAKNIDNAEAYQQYLSTHTDGNHIEEAENALKKVLGRDLQPEEKEMIRGLFRQFFQSINNRDEDALAATCEDILSSLLGKPTATKADVIVFLHKLYKEDVANMTWRINDDYQIKKREVGIGCYEYNVLFTTQQEVEHTDGSKSQNNFRVQAVVSPDAKISEFMLTKITTIAEEEQ